MKKIFCLIAVVLVLMVASVTFAQSIDSGDLKDLKGTWTGWATFQIGQGVPAELVILNDTVPVKAKLTLSQVSDAVGAMLGLGTADAGKKYTFSNDEGKITTQGSLMWAGNKNFIEFFLKRNKLDGWFYVNGAKGDIILHKK